MSEFLSAEWVDALDAHLSASGAGSSPTPLTVQYEVAAGQATIRYHLVLGPDGDRAHPGAADAPDVTFRLDRDTARQISEGALSSEEAFITGRLDLDGDPTLLIEAYRAGTGDDA